MLLILNGESFNISVLVRGGDRGLGRESLSIDRGGETHFVKLLELVLMADMRSDVING